MFSRAYPICVGSALPVAPERYRPPAFTVAGNVSEGFSKKGGAPSLPATAPARAAGRRRGRFLERLSVKLAAAGRLSAGEAAALLQRSWNGDVRARRPATGRCLPTKAVAMQAARPLAKRYGFGAVHFEPNTITAAGPSELFGSLSAGNMGACGALQTWADVEIEGDMQTRSKRIAPAYLPCRGLQGARGTPDRSRS